MTDFVFPPRAPSTLSVAGSAALFPIGRVFCIGRNYRWTADEAPPSEMPAWFMKPANAVVPAEGSLPYPHGTADFCHEIELVVAIGRGGRDIDPAQVEPHHVWGYAAGLDLTRRDLQQQAKRAGGPWEPAKAFDHSAPCTPLVPVTTCGHPRRGAIWLAVNGIERQRADLVDLLWPVPALVAMLSRSVALAPGDLIYTGTPAGVGALQPGDVVSGGIAGIGTFAMTVDRVPLRAAQQGRSLTTNTSRKIALVTGAGSGIGRSVALGLLDDGWAVVLAGRRIEPLQTLATEAETRGQTAMAVPTDVTDSDSVQALFTAIESRFGRLDLLFNNAGVNAPAVPMDELPLDKWFSVINTNVTGVFLCARAAFGLMRRQSPQGGRIINNGSVSAHTPRPFTAPYTASKHAVLGLTKALALDGRAFNIVASQIDIGNALTELSERMTRGVLQANGTTAPEPMMDARHVADAVRHIAAMPLSANVLTMTVMASAMPYVGRG